MTKEDIAKKIGRMGTTQIEKKLNDNAFSAEERVIAETIFAKRTGTYVEPTVVKAEEPKAAKKAAKSTVKKDDKSSKKDAVKQKKEGHGQIRATIKKHLEVFQSTSEVRKLVKKELKLERDIHYSEIKSVLDKLKEDAKFAKAYEKATAKPTKEEPKVEEKNDGPIAKKGGKGKGKKVEVVEEELSNVLDNDLPEVFPDIVDEEEEA